MKKTASNRPIAGKSFNWRRVLVVVLVWMALFSLYAQIVGPGREPTRLAYSEFKQAVENGRVRQVTFRGRRITGTFKAEEAEGEKRRGQDGGGGNDASGGADGFSTVLPEVEDRGLMPLLTDREVVVAAEQQQENWFWPLILAMLPWLLLIGFFVYSGNKMQERMTGQARGMFGFGKSKAKRFRENGSGVTFSDVAGLDNAKKEFREIVSFLKAPERFLRLGAALPNGVLMVGPPGVGKTLLAKAVAGEAGVPFFSISGSEFIEMFVGVGASRVRDMFAQAKKAAPAMIFIDELDAIGRARGAGLGGGHDEREQTLNQILAEMDGFSPRDSVIVIAATNRPDVLDTALVRPGRFDRRIHLELPQKQARKKILEIHLHRTRHADDIDMEDMARRTVGLSGADLKNLVNEAALLAARRGEEQVTRQALETARDKILMGLEREEVVEERERRIVACHEAGHALVATFMPEGDPLQKVTIIPRGRALGATEQIPEEDRRNLSRRYLQDRVAIMLGGRAAEHLVFSDRSTGAGDDLKMATQLVRRMVCQWGMSDTLGPVTFTTGDAHPFLGKTLSAPRDHSEATARLIDQEVRAMLTAAEKRAETVVVENRSTLDALTAALLDRETLTGSEIEQLLLRSDGVSGK